MEKVLQLLKLLEEQIPPLYPEHHHILTLHRDTPEGPLLMKLKLHEMLPNQVQRCFILDPSDWDRSPEDLVAEIMSDTNTPQPTPDEKVA